MKPRRLKKGAAERAKARQMKAELEAEYAKLEGARIAAVGDKAKQLKIKADQAQISEMYQALKTRKRRASDGGGGSVVRGFLRTFGR